MSFCYAQLARLTLAALVCALKLFSCHVGWKPQTRLLMFMAARAFYLCECKAPPWASML